VNWLFQQVAYLAPKDLTIDCIDLSQNCILYNDSTCNLQHVRETVVDVDDVMTSALYDVVVTSCQHGVAMS